MTFELLFKYLKSHEISENAQKVIKKCHEIWFHDLN